MVERAYPRRAELVDRSRDDEEAIHRTGSRELRRSAQWGGEPDDDVPLFISESYDEAEPSEFLHELRPRRKYSVSFRILAVVSVAAATAIVFAFLSSDATRSFVQASMAGLIPAPLAATPSDAAAQATAARANALRTSALERKAPAAPEVATASVAPQPDATREVYQPRMPVPAVVESPTPPPVVLHRLDPGEITAAIGRAEALMKSGDFAAARLVLRRPADDGDGQAAIKLAETYDPEFLGKGGARGTVADTAMARDWYEKARKYGAEQAAERLERLASSR